MSRETYYKLVARREDADFEAYGGDEKGYLFPVVHDKPDKVQEIEKLEAQILAMHVVLADSEAEVERLETMVRWARADSEALNIENKRYREALEAIKKHQETMNQGDGPLKDRKLYEFTAAWNIAQKALDGDTNG